MKEKCTALKGKDNIDINFTILLNEKSVNVIKSKFNLLKSEEENFVIINL